MSETTPAPSLAGSTLWRIDRLVRNDDNFSARVRAAAALAGITVTDDLLLKVASAPDVLAAVTVGDLNVVSSDQVTDDVIITAVQSTTEQGA